MDLGVLLESPRGVSPRNKRGHARALSSRSVAAMSCFPSRGSRNLWISLEDFPGGLPTGLSHVPPWCESIHGMKVEAAKGEQVPLEWTETSGVPWEWWHYPGVTLAFPGKAPPLEMRREGPEFFPDKAAKGSVISSYEAETGLLWMWAGPSCFL